MTTPRTSLPVPVGPAGDLVVPVIGTVVDLGNTADCARALQDIRDLEWRLRETKAALVDAIVQHSKEEGSKTIHFEGGKVEVRGDSETVYDAEEIEQGLRAAGMPEHRIREIVVEQVSYKVAALEAKRAAGANPEYAKVIEAHKRVVEKTPSVSVKLA